MQNQQKSNILDDFGIDAQNRLSELKKNDPDAWDVIQVLGAIHQKNLNHINNNQSDAIYPAYNTINQQIFFILSHYLSNNSNDNKIQDQAKKVLLSAVPNFTTLNEFKL